MNEVSAILFGAITAVNLASIFINLKLYTEIMKEKSQRDRSHGPEENKQGSNPNLNPGNGATWL